MVMIMDKNILDTVWECFQNMPEERQKEIYLSMATDTVYIFQKSLMNQFFETEKVNTETLCDAVAKSSDFMLYVPTDTLVLWNHTKSSIITGNCILELIDDEKDRLVQGIMDNPKLLKEVLAYKKDYMD